MTSEEKDAVRGMIVSAVAEAIDKVIGIVEKQRKTDIDLHRATCPHGLTILKTKAMFIGIVIAASVLGGGIGSVIARLIMSAIAT